jgi:hypothetical protein
LEGLGISPKAHKESHIKNIFVVFLMVCIFILLKIEKKRIRCTYPFFYLFIAQLISGVPQLRRFVLGPQDNSLRHIPNSRAPLFRLLPQLF